MAKENAKVRRLKDQGVLNPHPERVRAPHFQAGGFFDPRDLVQVKYEMLRQAQLEGHSKAQAAALFGLSRPTFYQAEGALADAGLNGLLPHPRGPKGAHKLTADVMAFIEKHVPADSPMSARSLARAIKTERGLVVHPRSIERALARKKKR